MFGVRAKQTYVEPSGSDCPNRRRNGCLERQTEGRGGKETGRERCVRDATVNSPSWTQLGFRQAFWDFWLSDKLPAN